jgi:hypothetical protein
MCLLVQQQTPCVSSKSLKNKKTKKIIKSEKNYHFVLAISQFTIALFFHLKLVGLGTSNCLTKIFPI